ncbi:epidermal growth factor receptor kinase substrate 8-like protein 1 [Phoca vitulina]|uniref:epidermal growth factor receptor kinase substrate 8-like protein 1 n=1 Tax=Phoca vitulina TaxID=9720 RepID=UPI001395E88A|nr:epidermal growth factor receptor kinase substrate 8-like protein 1 [Phoca vitulina]
MADVSQYPVNHLVTFCLGEEDGVHTVEDASRKLAVMDSQGRIWAQEMLLRVSPDHVTLLDPISKEELESYPLGAIVRCDVVLLPGRSRSLLLLVCQEPERTQPDVHFFQGLRLGGWGVAWAEAGSGPAEGAWPGKKFWNGGGFEDRLHPVEAELIREDVQGALHDYRSGRGERRPAALRATQEELQRRPSPVAETPPLQRRPSVRAVISTVGVSRGRSQAEPIPEAAEESQRPGQAQTAGSADPASPDPGPGGPDLASLQAERDVVSGAGLGPGEGLLTLRAKPPSEAEYTDVLQKIKYAFSLLARLSGNIANPSSPELLHILFGPLQLVVDSSGGPQFASEVRRPHLTSEAVALLRDNLTPRENALWTSLGDSWTRPGLELPPEEGSPYSPEFSSGWEPPATDPHGRACEDPVDRQLQHERRRQQQSAPQVAVNGHQDSEPEAEPQLEPEGKWVLCNYDFQARNSSELSVKQQDVLEVLDDRRKWWKVRDQQGQEGYVPYNILTPHPRPQGSCSQSPSHSLEDSTPPHPPAPAPAPTLSRPHWDSGDNLNLDPREKEKFSQMLCVNEELQARLAQGRSGPSRAAPAPRAPELQLSPHSDTAEVRAWLQAKGFSAGTVDALGVLTGAQLFSLQKEELRAVSPEEGTRVYSQVTVQRALLEDKEKVSELDAVMEKQKKKVEGNLETEVI